MRERKQLMSSIVVSHLSLRVFFCCGGFNILVVPNLCLNLPSSFEKGM